MAQLARNTVHDALLILFIRAKGTYSLNLVNLIGNRGAICEHEIYNDFQYYQDRPYFHTFAGDVRAKNVITLCRLIPMEQDCMIGIVFPAESDPKNVFKRYQIAKKSDVRCSPDSGNTY